MFIDANIFLEIALKDTNYQKCVEFIKNILKNNKNIYTSDFIVYSCLLILHNKLNSYIKMKDFLVFVNSSNISILRPSLKAMYDTIDFMKRYRLDFNDSLIIGCMLENNIKCLVSYDKHFDKVKEIEVIRP